MQLLAAETYSIASPIWLYEQNVQMDSHPPPQPATAGVPAPPSPGLKQPGHADEY